MVKICKNCNNDFKTYKKQQKFCSKTCSGEFSRIERINKECEYSGCTNTIEIYKNSKTLKQQKFCSIPCQNNWQKNSQLGENNGNFGRENKWGNHSKEKRKEISEKIKKTWENPERLKKHLEFLERHRLDDGSFDFQDDLFRNKISKANVERLLNSPEYGAYKNCKRGWYHSNKTDDDEYYHSSWEENKMIELDGDNSVKFWTKKHGYVIKYYFDGSIKRYLPDFLVDNQIIEVKGYIKNIDKFKIKTESALKFFSEKNIDYNIDFMKNKNKYKSLIKWFNNKKKLYYE